jgi:hypothetical protein
MRRFLRKPLGTPIRDFIARLVEMNNYLPQFPPQQLGGAVGVILDDEELKGSVSFLFLPRGRRAWFNTDLILLIIDSMN